MIMCNTTNFKIKTFIGSFTEQLQAHSPGAVTIFWNW